MKTAIISLIIMMSSFSYAEQSIEVLNCLMEAAGEPLEGKVAVYRTVYSRVKSSKYPASTEEVILQKNQFSWTREIPDILFRKFTDKQIADCEKAEKIAKKLGAWEYKHYFATDGGSKIDPPHWAKAAKKKKKINNHLFLALD